MTPPKKQAAAGPLAERDRLLSLLADLDEKGLELNERHRAARAAVDHAEGAVAQCRVASFLGEDEPEAVEKAVEDRQAARGAIATIEEEVHAWRRATDLTQRKLVTIAFRHREAWEDELAALAGAADEAIAKLAEPIAEARAAWSEAAAGYRGLARWLYHTRGRALDDHELPHEPGPFPIDVRSISAAPKG